MENNIDRNDLDLLHGIPGYTDLIEHVLAPNLIGQLAAVVPPDLAGISDLGDLCLRFAHSAVNGDISGLIALLDDRQAKQLGHHVLLHDLIAPCARQLGPWWERDEANFIDVTIGISALLQLVHHLERSTSSRPVLRHRMPRALFASIDKDSHSFGPALLASYFRHAGWDAEYLCENDGPELEEALTQRRIDVVGLAVTCDPSEPLPGSITRLRRISANPSTYVLLGGHAIDRNPELLEGAGCDGTAATLPDVLRLANLLTSRSMGAVSDGLVA